MTKQIDKHNLKPLYYQLKEILQQEIMSGKLKPGDAIPSERELIDYYKISRTPVRQAINDLVTEGFLVRRHGKGTFVAEQKKMRQWFLESLTSFDDEMNQKGLRNQTKVLNHTIIEPTDKLSSVFQHKYKKYHYIRRLRYIKKMPYVLVDTFIPYEMAPGLIDIDFEKNSLYKTLEMSYDFNIDYALRDIESIAMNQTQAELLQTEVNAPAHLITTNTFLENDVCFEYSIGCYRGDLNKFSVRVGVKV